MTQKELDVIFEIAITLHENEWFGKRNEPKDRETVQEWVAAMLADNLNIYTIPCGVSWGVLTTKEEYEKYWNEHSKLNK